VVTIVLNLFSLFCAGVWVIVALSSSNQPQILRYSDSMGIFKIGSIGDILMLIITGMIFATANYLLATSLQDRNKFLSLLTSAVSIFVSALIFIAVSAMIGVN
jgi:hypothetical protein